MKKASLLFIFFMVIFSVQADITARLYTEKNRYYTGEPITLTLEVQGVEGLDSVPDLFLDGFVIDNLGGRSNNRSSLVIINGKKQQDKELSYIYQWKLTPGYAGSFTLESLSLDIDSDTVKTNAVKLIIEDPVSVQDGYELKVTSDKTLVYPGDSVIITAELLFDSKIAELSFNTNLFDGFKGKVEGVAPGQKNDVYSLPFGSSEFPGSLGAVMNHGKQLSVLTMKILLRPDNSGLLDSLWISSSFQGAEGKEAVKDFFGRTVYQDKYKQFYLHARLPEIQVKTLPFRADNKGGQLLGPLDISVKTDKTEVNTGEPVHFKVIYKGEGLERNQNLPDVRFFEEWGDSFTFASEPPEITENNDSLVWSTVIRAAKEETNGVPSFDFPVFNVEKEVWEIVTTKPVLMNVSFIPSIGSKQLQSFDNSAPVVSRNISELPEEAAAIAARLFPPDDKLKMNLLVPGIKTYLFALIIMVIFNILLIINKKISSKKKASINHKREEWTHVLETINKQNPSTASLYRLFNLLESDETLDSSMISFRNSLSDVLFSNKEVEKASLQWPDPVKKKRLFPFLLLLLMFSCSFSGSDYDSETGVSLRQSENYFRQALKEESPDTKTQLFEQALFYYKKLENLPDSSIQAGLGVIYSRLDNPGLAAWHLGQARRLSPSSFWIKEYVKAVSPEEKHSYIKDDLLFLSFLSVEQRSIAAFLSFLGILVSLSLLFRKKGLSVIILFIFTALFLWSSSVILYEKTRPSGVLIEDTMARQGDGEFYEPGFSNELPAGTAARTITELKGWTEIVLNSGKRVWIPSDSFSPYLW